MYLKKLDFLYSLSTLQKTEILGTAKILRKLLEKENEKKNNNKGKIQN